MERSTYLSTATSFLVAGQLITGTTIVPLGPDPVLESSTGGGWHFTLGFYAWGAGHNGDLGAAGHVAPVDLSFSDILDTLDMTAMGAAELRKGRWLFQFEGLYLRNSVKGVPAYTPFRNTPITGQAHRGNHPPRSSGWLPCDGQRPHHRRPACRRGVL